MPKDVKWLTFSNKVEQRQMWVQISWVTSQDSLLGTTCRQLDTWVRGTGCWTAPWEKGGWKAVSDVRQGSVMTRILGVGKCWFIQGDCLFISWTQRSSSWNLLTMELHENAAKMPWDLKEKAVVQLGRIPYTHQHERAFTLFLSVKETFCRSQGFTKKG